MTARQRSWLAQWAAATTLAAGAATAADVVLLQLRVSYFTGGFLSLEHLRSSLQIALFLAASLVADAVVLGPLIGLVLFACARLRFSEHASIAGAVLLALAPVAIVDFLSYRLQSFLGDAFDLQLMFDLTGRNPMEVIAVASGHASQLAALGALAAAAAGCGVWLWRRPRSQAIVAPAWRTAALGGVGLVAAGMAVTTAVMTSSRELDNGLSRKPTARLLKQFVDTVTDIDRDGFGLLGRLPDPDVFDGRVYPHAVDEPGNGLDEDGVGGDLLSAVPYREPPDDPPTWAVRPPVVLVALESFRADVVGAVVAGVPVTPTLDSLAKAGISLAHAYSHNGYTVQSRHHFFSGSLAGLRATSLIDDFNANGYETAYFSAQDDSFGDADLAVGFDRAAISYDARQDRDRRYTSFTTAGSLAVSSDVLLERVERFLAARRNERPLFLYVNFHDTHFPYHHRQIRPLLQAPVLAESAIEPHQAPALRAMYMNTAANVDRAIGTLLGRVRHAVGEDPGVIVLADHGESLFDEGFLGHGYALNDAQTRIPAVVSGLPLELVEPFGQADLRDALTTALTVATKDRVPRVRQDARRRVFQYLGNIDRPAQIGFAGLDGRFVFDFRSNRVQSRDSTWLPPAELRGSDRDEFQDLLQLWERMMLARRRLRVSRG